MSNSLNRCKLRHGWIKPFLAGVKRGLNDMNAANAAGESTTTILRYAEKDPIFKAEFAAARAAANTRPRGAYGAF